MKTAVMKTIEKIINIISASRQFFTVEIWKIELDNLSMLKARLIKNAKIVIFAFHNFARQKTGYQSVALCYYSVMAVVPLIAVIFAITRGFGLTPKLTDFLYVHLGSDTVLTEKILIAADNIVKSARSGVAGVISALTFLWAVIWMMMMTESVFNDVWHVKKSRNFFKSLGVNIIIILLIPFVTIIFFTGNIVYSKMLDYVIPNYPGITEIIKSFLGWTIFGTIVIFVLSAMYKFIPAAKVRYWYAFKGAVISGIVFTLLQFLYVETQFLVMGVNAVYGTIAAIPLFLLWLRYGWLIILYGAQFSYSFQMVESDKIGQL